MVLVNSLNINFSDGEIIDLPNSNQARILYKISRNVYIVEVNHDVSKEPCVFKVAPKLDGALFTEFRIYTILSKMNSIYTPKILTFGCKKYIDKTKNKIDDLRIIIIEKLGRNISSLSDCVLPFTTIIQTLKKLHLEKGYQHGDIKPENIVLGKNDSYNALYLIDFGNTSKMQPKDYKGRPFNTGNGTREFISRNAIKGKNTQLNDLESLGYTLYTLLTKKFVPKKRTEFFNNLNNYLEPESNLYKYFKFIENRDWYNEEDYKYIDHLIGKFQI